MSEKISLDSSVSHPFFLSYSQDVQRMYMILPIKFREKVLIHSQR